MTKVHDVEYVRGLLRQLDEAGKAGDLGAQVSAHQDLEHALYHWGETVVRNLVGRIEALEGELEIARGFHDVAVAERNHARFQVDQVLKPRVRVLSGALRELVQLKELKDAEGKTEIYRQEQPKAWARARAALEDA